MAGGQCRGAEIARGLEQFGELDRLVAGDTGNGRFARDIALRERVDDGLAEALFIVEHVVRDAERLGDAPRILDIAPGAAGAGAVRGGAVIVELQRDADHVIAFTLEDARPRRRN